ncbi:MAG TPA: serine hydrolase domain-containing protein [Ktedonosporobacter sp.]|nr:serine hydrolase domain-containing protein [Ktedonosporobacter sp.]
MQSSRKYLHYWLSLVLLIMLAGCGVLPGAPDADKATAATTPKPLPNTAKIEGYLNHLADGGQLSGTVLIAENGSIFSKGYSLANEDTHTPNTTQTMFRIGSITKQFTAMAILILQEHGKLHVQDHICLYIQDCPQDWQPITIQHLLTHTSGIPDYINAPDLLDFWTQPATPEQLVAHFKNLPLKFAPGSGYSYSNSGYTLLGYIIERITGEPYATFLRENIFDPLKMSHSGYDSTSLQAGHATGYYKGYDKPDAYDISVFYAAGALYSTVGDLYTWDQALAQHKLISAQAYKDMFTSHACTNEAAADGCGPGYGYGWFIEQGGKYIYHVGHIDGYYSYNSFYPERDLDIIVLSNLETTDVLHIGRTLASML